MDIGKDASDNWRIIKEANQTDWWFHADKTSSAHVIIHNSKITKEQIIEACTLVKQRCKFRNNPRVKIIYTQISNLKKGSDVGAVIIRNRKKCKTMII